MSRESKRGNVRCLIAAELASNRAARAELEVWSEQEVIERSLFKFLAA
jgi:hypothetical protein